MTTQPNEHQKVLRDFILSAIAVYGNASKGHINLTNLVEMANELNIAKIEKAMDWMLKAEVRG